MQKKLCLVLSLTVSYVAESTSVGLGSLEYDQLDTKLSDLRYETGDLKLGDFFKPKNNTSSSKKETEKETKTSAKVSGSKKNNSENKGVKGEHNIGDLEKFFSIGGAYDKGFYAGDDIFAIANGIAAKAIGVEGSEKRKYEKGSKTKGFHKVHHKDEYKKENEFYEDDEVKGSINKVGAKALGGKFAAGAGFNKGNYHRDSQKGIFGKQGYWDMGYFDKEFDGFSDSKGIDGSFIKGI